MPGGGCCLAQHLKRYTAAPVAHYERACEDANWTRLASHGCDVTGGRDIASRIFLDSSGVDTQDTCAGWTHLAWQHASSPRGGMVERGWRRHRNAQRAGTLNERFVNVKT